MLGSDKFLEGNNRKACMRLEILTMFSVQATVFSDICQSENSPYGILSIKKSTTNEHWFLGSVYYKLDERLKDFLKLKGKKTKKSTGLD